MKTNIYLIYLNLTQYNNNSAPSENRTPNTKDNLRVERAYNTWKAN